MSTLKPTLVTINYKTCFSSSESYISVFGQGFINKSFRMGHTHSGMVIVDTFKRGLLREPLAETVIT